MNLVSQKTYQQEKALVYSHQDSYLISGFSNTILGRVVFLRILLSQPSININTIKQAIRLPNTNTFAHRRRQYYILFNTNT